MREVAGPAPAAKAGRAASANVRQRRPRAAHAPLRHAKVDLVNSWLTNSTLASATSGYVPLSARESPLVRPQPEQLDSREPLERQRAIAGPRHAASPATPSPAAVRRPRPTPPARAARASPATALTGRRSPAPATPPARATRPAPPLPHRPPFAGPAAPPARAARPARHSLTGRRSPAPAAPPARATRHAPPHAPRTSQPTTRVQRDVPRRPLATLLAPLALTGCAHTDTPHAHQRPSRRRPTSRSRSRPAAT